MGIKLSEWKLKITENIGGTLGKINAATDKAAGKFTALQDKVNKFSSGVKNAASEVPGLNHVLELTSNPYVGLAAGITAVVGVLYKATDMAMTFEKGMAKVNVTAGLTPKKLDVVKDRLMDIGSRSTVDLLQIPDAFNQVISAVGDVDKSLQIFEPTLKAAKAGFTDVKVVADAVTNIMGSVKDATPTEAFDTLFATMNRGKVEFGDIANYLPKILPFSNNLAASWKETAGAFALMTAKGQSVEGTTTMLQNMYRAFANKDRIKDFEAMGVAIFDNAGKIRKLPDIIDDLSRKLDKFGNNTKAKTSFLAALGLDAEASSGLSVLVQNAKELRDFTNSTINSAGAMEKVYGDSLNTADKYLITQQRFNKLMIELGYKLLPHVNKGLEKVNEFMDWFNSSDSERVKDGFREIGFVIDNLIIKPLQYMANFTDNFTEGLNKDKARFAGIAAMLNELKNPLYFIGEAFSNLFNPAKLRANLASFVSSVQNMDLSKAFDNGYEKSMDQSLGIKLRPVPFVVAPDKRNPFEAHSWKAPTKTAEIVDAGFPKPPVKDPADKTKILGGINAIAEGGKSVKNLTVNIDSLIKGNIQIAAQNIKEGAEDVRRIVLEELVRAVNGGEVALG